MKVNLSETIEQEPELVARLETVSTLLEDVLGPSAAPLVQADWNLLKDVNGRDLINLTVSDWTGSVGYRFAPEELKNSAHMRMRLHRLWGDLLQVRSHVQMDENWWALQTQAEH